MKIDYERLEKVRKAAGLNPGSSSSARPRTNPQVQKLPSEPQTALYAVLSPKHLPPMRWMAKTTEVIQHAKEAKARLEELQRSARQEGRAVNRSRQDL